LKCKFSGSLCKVEIGEIICHMIPSGSGYFIRLGIFVLEGLARFGTAFLDFAIVGDLGMPGGHNPHRKSVITEKYTRTLCGTGHMASRWGNTHLDRSPGAENCAPTHCSMLPALESSRVQVRGHVTPLLRSETSVDPGTLPVRSHLRGSEAVFRSIPVAEGQISRNSVLRSSLEGAGGQIQAECH